MKNKRKWASIRGLRTALLAFVAWGVLMLFLA